MLKTKRSNSRSGVSKRVKNTLAEMIGPESDQGKDFKLKGLLGLEYSNTMDYNLKKSNEALSEEMTTLDLNSNNSKDSNNKGSSSDNLNFPEKVKELKRSHSMGSRSAFNHVKAKLTLGPSRLDILSQINYDKKEASSNMALLQNFFDMANIPHFTNLDSKLFNFENSEKLLQTNTNAKKLKSSQSLSAKMLFSSIKKEPFEYDIFKNVTKTMRDNNNSYLSLLVDAAESLIQRGLTTFEELANSEMPLNYFQQETQILRYCDNGICLAKGPKKSKMWTKVKDVQRTMWLCSPCGQAWANKQYCFYCLAIYTDNSGTASYNDNKNWVMCDYCQMWHHIQCEEIHGMFFNLSHLLEDEEFKYMCPTCRGKDETEKINSNHLLNLVVNSNSLTLNQNTPLKDKRKRKEKTIRTKQIEKNEYSFLMKKRNSSTNDYESIFKINLAIPQFRKKRNTRNNITSYSSQNYAKTSFSFSSKNKIKLDSVDSREIYHDYYKILNLNEKKKI